MAYSIENFAAPVLANAKKQNKKAEKKVGLQNLALLGVQVANQALRSRAIKRSEEFFNGAQPILQRAKQNVDAGLEFWGSHNSMLGEKYTPADWKIAKAEQLFNSEFARQGVPLASDEKVRAFSLFLEDEGTKETLSRYEKEMGLHEEFKGGASADARKEIRTSYYGPIEDMITKETTRMAGDNTIVSSLMKSLNLKEDSRLDDIDVRGTQRPREDLSLQEQEIMDFFHAAGEKRQKLNELAGVTGTTKMRFSHFTSNEVVDLTEMYQNQVFMDLRNKMRAGATIVELQQKIDDGEFSVITTLTDEDGENAQSLDALDIWHLLPDVTAEGELQAPRTQFANDLTELASVISYNWHYTETQNQQRGNDPMSPPSEIVFINAAMQLLASGNPEIGVESRLTYDSGGFGGFDSVEYDKLERDDMTALANHIQVVLPDDQYESLYGSFDKDDIRVSPEAIRIEQERDSEGTPLPFTDYQTYVNGLVEQLKDTENFSSSQLSEIRQAQDALYSYLEMGEDAKTIESIYALLGDFLPTDDGADLATTEDTTEDLFEVIRELNPALVDLTDDQIKNLNRSDSLIRTAQTILTRRQNDRALIRDVSDLGAAIGTTFTSDWEREKALGRLKREQPDKYSKYEGYLAYMDKEDALAAALAE
jgi:hypothetical protein